jgi:hypothetical protein
VASTDDIVEALDSTTPELIALREANRTLQRQLVKAKASKEELVNAVHLAARDAAVIIGHPPKVPKPPKIVTQGSTPHEALLHTTDWQGGKKTADYDLEVLGRRLTQTVDKTIMLTDRHGHPVEEITVMFGGDDIEGVTIFPSQPFEVHAGLYEQVFAVVKYKRMVIDMLKTRYRKVKVKRKWGNHGRIGKFGELPDTDNLDLMADRIAAEWYEDDPQVEWDWMNLDYVQQFRIGHYHAALLHGNEFYKSFSAQRIVAKVQAWQTIYGFGDVYMGHFHRSDEYGLANGTMVYMTASPESSNSYAADQLAAIGKPAQRLHFIDPVAGRVQAKHILSLD